MKAKFSGKGNVRKNIGAGRFGKGKKRRKKPHEMDTASKKGKIIVNLKPNSLGFV